VKTVLEAETSSYANGPQAVTRTMAYAPDGRILEERFRNTDGSEVVRSYHYYPDGRLIGIVSRNAATAESSVTTYPYDDARRLIEVKSCDDKESRQFRFLREVWSKLNLEEITPIGARDMACSCTYDEQGRVKVRRLSLRFVEQVTITTYNDYGDKASERTTAVMNIPAPPREFEIMSDGIMFDTTIVGTSIPLETAHPSERSLEILEVRYTYHYDQYGNWTEQTSAGRSQPDEAFRPGAVIRRKLTYY